LLTEGRAKIIKQGNDVFYNEAQVRCTRCVCSVLLLLLFQQQAPVGFVALCFPHHAVEIDMHSLRKTRRLHNPASCSFCLCLLAVALTLHCLLFCLQVTNRDLSVAVLRKFLPQLAQELADGTLKRKMKTAPPKHEAAANGGPAPAKVGLGC
jgi:hypothetical protein